MSGSSGGGGCCRDFRLGFVNMISVDLEWFSVRLFCSDHFSMFSISAFLVAMLLEGIIRYVLSAYLHNMLPAFTVFRSPVFTTYKAEPIEDPCVMLAEISTRSDCWFW